MRFAGRLATCAFILLVPAHAAETCSDALSTSVAGTLRPVVEGIRACSGLKTQIKNPFPITIGVDQTDRVELRALRYCSSQTDSRLTASIYVRCRTSDAAVIKLALDETVDAEMTVRNSDCALMD